MGTACTVSVTARDADRLRARQALVAASAEVEACERALSRFDPASDLSRLNAASGEWVEIDRRLERALRAALRLRDGDRRQVRPDDPARPRRRRLRPQLRAARRASRPHRRRLAGRRRDRAQPPAAPGSSAAPPSTSAASARASRPRCALAAMRAAWPAMPGAIVDLGGDIAAWGSPPDRGPWRIAIADPRSDGATLGVLRLEQGGVATSGRNARRFGPSGSLHHLIDPGTGAPASRGPLAVTVVAPDPAEAEGHATALGISSLAEADEPPRRAPRARRAVRRRHRRDALARSAPARAAHPDLRSGAMNAFLAQAPVAWYVARAAGLVAFGLLTLSVWLGLGMSTRLLGPKRQKSLFGWHQTLAWTGLSMLALHAGALLFDPTLHFGLASVLAPFASAVAPGRSRSRRRRRLAHARARAVVPDAEANRPARLAQAALRELRRLRPRTRARAHRRHRPQRHRRPPARQRSRQDP